MYNINKKLREETKNMVGATQQSADWLQNLSMPYR